jgi:malto-oligosyltrehalose trehalohydrolase
MPFGTQTGMQGTRFRLWAPTVAERGAGVDLAIEAPATSPDGTLVPGDAWTVAMTARDDGWFEAMVDTAREGHLYRFHVPDGAGGTLAVPDPASRFQPFGVHGASEIIAPEAYSWGDGAWTGRPWDEAVLYELHVGTFTPDGTYQGVIEKLDHLVEMGVTAIELMPVAAAPGRRNWGYDGVGLFAPACAYGRPALLKQLVDSAHQRGLMVLLDAVYNHFGPEGNYLHVYAKRFFDEDRHTPWGAAINFDREGSRAVRDFFIHNALYWLEEFHMDGLRLDAVHAIADTSSPDILEELAERVAHGPGATRPIHLVLENDDNAARYLRRDDGGRPRHYVAQWNDDIHHAYHVLLTGEDGGYYGDYAADPAAALARCLGEGFAYQGEASPHRGGGARGTPSAELPPQAFVAFTQNHDQIGNRAFGERLERLAPPAAVEASLALLLLSPQPPLLFMGQEWAASTPFLYFADMGAELADAVRNGRRDEFSGFPEFADPAARARIPDPMDAGTMDASRLNWAETERDDHAARLALVRRLLTLRHREIVPRLGGGDATVRSLGATAEGSVVTAAWRLADGSRLTLLANLSATPRGAPRTAGTPPPGRVLAALPSGSPWRDDDTLAAWAVLCVLDDAPSD